jgi:transposase
MLSLSPSVRIWICAQPADLRKSFDGLAALVREWLGADPLSGHIFVFRSKSADRVRFFVWEEVSARSYELRRWPATPRRVGGHRIRLPSYS